MNGDMFEDAPADFRMVDMDIPDKAWPTVLAEYVEVVLGVLRRRGRSQEDALDESQEIVVALAKHRGGRNEYLPTGDRLYAAVRNRRIWLSWKGDNMDELVERFSLTERSIQLILAEQRAIQVRRSQGQLFPD